MLYLSQASIPAEWRGAYTFLLTPLLWLPDWHTAVLSFAWYGGSTIEVLLKRVIILPTALLLVAAVWATMISIYTVPFRSGRRSFLESMVASWWDAGRCAWFYWAGVVRVVVVLVGWVWGLLRAAVRFVVTAIKWSFRYPLSMLDWTSRKYFKPGVPWVAFLALVFWCVIEAVIFMYTLTPTMTEVMAGITGFEPNPAVMAPIMWIFLFFLILGSFACIHALTESIRQRKVMGILEMTFVELFVMFFEVIFLYRELIDAITPWIAQQTGGQVQLGLVATIALASFGWIGVRGMTWFLFGRFGTPALLAVLSRQTILREEVPVGEMARQPQLETWKSLIAALKEETEWFKKEAQNIFELISLPVLQLLAAAANFIVVLILSRPMFKLPFSSLEEVRATTPGLSGAKDMAQSTHYPHEGGIQ